MFVLYILGVLVLIIILLLCLPLRVNLKFLDDFYFDIKILGFKVYPIKEKKSDKPQNTQSKETTEKSLFEKLKEKRGFKGAIKELFSLFFAVLNPLKRFLRFIKFRKIKISLSVAGEDAAKTAIDYGIICSIVYPVLSLFDSILNVKYKSIDIRSDFEGKESNFDFSLSIKISIIYILIFGYKIFKEYKNFCVRNDLQ